MTTRLLVAAPPPGEWLSRLRRGDYIYLCKEDTFACVGFPWLPSRPGHVAGELMFSRTSSIGRLLPPEVWCITGDGYGFDGRPLVLPCQGYLGEAGTTNQLSGEWLLLMESCLSRVRGLERQHETMWQRCNSIGEHVRELAVHMRQIADAVVDLQSRLVPTVPDDARDRIIRLD